MNDLLAEAVHRLAERARRGSAPPRTWVGNAPMAAAFGRCGSGVVDRLTVRV